MINKYERMCQHLLTQFHNSSNIKALLYAISEELRILNVALDDLKYKRWIDTAEGKQLDGIGQIIDQSRLIEKGYAIPFFGFEGQPNTKGFGQARFRTFYEEYLTTAKLDDEMYRHVLWAKVHKNTAYGSYEDTIKSIQYLFNVDIVIVHNIGNAKFIVGIGKELESNELVLANALNLLVRAGGVGHYFISSFDVNKKVFGFEGQKYAKGFGQAPFSTILHY